MPDIRIGQRSFSSGEIAPELYGRVDLTKYQTGLATCRNFIVLPHGPVANRTGTEFVRETKYSGTKKSRLIPFSYNNTQTFAVEIGAGYFRWYTQGAVLLCGSASAWVTSTAYVVGDLRTNGGTTYYCKTAHTSGTFATDLAAGKWYAQPASGEYEIPNSYAEADLFDIHYVQSADVLTLVHPSYSVAELRRYGATNWQLTNPTFTPPANTITSTTVSASKGTGTYLYQYVVTCVNKDGLEESVSTSPYSTTTKSITGITLANPGVFTVTAHGRVTGDVIYVAGVQNSMTQLPDGYYQVTNLTADTFSLKDVFGTAINTTSYTAYTSGGTIATASGVTNNLTTAGNYNSVTWVDPSAANHIRYNVYKLSNGLFGYIGQAGAPPFTDENITADISITPPITDSGFNDASGNYPAAVGYFEQRRVFGGTSNKPQNVWMTRSATESNMSYTIPSQDDNRIAFRIAAREASAIKHLVPVTNIILLTPSCEWRVTSVNSDVITPTTISVKPQSYIGANNVTPVVVGTGVLFAAARGGHIREMTYNWQAQGYLTQDVSLMAPHLFDYYTVSDMAFSRAQYPILWSISSSGYLLGMTYVPEQQIVAWHKHDTDGTFESVTTVTENNEDMVYLVIKRTINGTSKRYIERIRTRYFSTQSDCFYVDCGVTFNGANTGSTTVTVSGGTLWGIGETLTITSSAALFTYPAQTDVNDAIVLTGDDGTTYTLTIKSTTSTTVATATVDKTLAAQFRNIATAVFNFARDSISGLTWLEGKTVNILADGAVHPQRTVTSGAISLQQAASKVQIGLPITADIKTLPLAYQAMDYGQGRPKNINSVFLRVSNSSGIWAGPGFDKLTQYKQRTTETYGSAPALKTDEIRIVIDGRYTNSGQVCVRQTDPLPLTIEAMTVEAAVGG